ncbi:sodium/potassium-transporting ATPase subunit beta-like [Portunus trituberculatus]|uniref:sodium/potassium-transporting ATPase subunit beta-like n=1 Tax=Portunus trituberculatus TaxID=210409 RepID=UPI001E1CD304|nr:sodium/potassium-transporting ATPase subunit beta-like [Portunus trituberculatus]
MSAARYREGEAVVVSRLPPSDQERSFQTFLWNRKAGAVLGRTPSSWAKIGLFYIVFYIFLAGFFSLLMFVFYQTIDLKVPKYTGQESLLRNPGLSYRPKFLYSDDLRPTIIYEPGFRDTALTYIYSINEFLQKYDNRSPTSNSVTCVPGEEVPAGSLCDFDILNVNTSCSKENDWGYSTNSPCLLLKLNRMFSWTPEPHHYLDELPEGLQQHLNSSVADPHMVVKKYVWVWCESDDVKIEQLSPGIPVNFFPFFNQEGYISPFVFVRIQNLPIDQKVKVRCRAWANNIEHRINKRLTGEAVVYFHLY